jgi:uncharacterized membrane protein
MEKGLSSLVFWLFFMVMAWLVRGWLHKIFPRLMKNENNPDSFVPLGTALLTVLAMGLTLALVGLFFRFFD